MNSIEQLAEYEKAKEHLNELQNAPKDAYSWSRLIQGENIKQALLEYRKENNIFEVDDLVTHPAYDWKILKVHDPIPSEGILFAKTNDHVKHHWGEGLVFDRRYVVCVSYNECRHVTNDEIKAGKRL